MELKINKERVLSAAAKCPTASNVLKELFPEAFEKKDFKCIKTFKDACEDLKIHQDDVYNDRDSVDEMAYKKLKVIASAINQGWTPDWDSSNQRKWFPYFNLSSGFGFSDSDYNFVN